MRRRLLFDRLPWQRSASSALIRYSRLLLHVCDVVRRTARFAQHGTVLRSVVLLIRIFYLHSSRLACFLTSVLFEHLSPTQPRYRQPTRVSRANVAVKMRKKKIEQTFLGKRQRVQVVVALMICHYRMRSPPVVWIIAGTMENGEPGRPRRTPCTAYYFVPMYTHRRNVEHDRLHGAGVAHTTASVVHAVRAAGTYARPAAQQARRRVV